MLGLLVLDGINSIKEACLETHYKVAEIHEIHTSNADATRGVGDLGVPRGAQDLAGLRPRSTQAFSQNMLSTASQAAGHACDGVAGPRAALCDE